MKTVLISFLRHLIRRKSLNILQILGVACGVAAVIGMTLSARSALSSFGAAVDFLKGKATHVLEKPAGPMEETVLADLMKDPSVDSFSPVIDRKIRLADGESVRILGVDPFLDRAIRPEVARIRPKQGSDIRSAFVTFLTDQRSVIIDENLSRRIGGEGNRVLRTSLGDFTVLSTFPNPSGEPLVIIDIAHSQELFSQRGLIDRVDLVVNDEQGLRSRWGTGFRIESKGERRETLEAMLRAFKLNLQALSLLALFVGVFLIYNTAMFAVVSRRKDAGILRSLGAHRSEIVGAFLAEILLLGFVGGALGGVLGYFLSRLLTVLVGSTISSLYFFLTPSPLPWSNINILAGVVLGCGASLLGSLSPLVELAQIPPALTIRGRIPDREHPKRVGKHAITGLLLIICSVVLLLLSSIQVYIGFAGAFVFLLGASFCSGFVLVHVIRPLQWLFTRFGGLAGKVAVGNIAQNSSRTSVAIAAFMVALSMSIGLGSMIGSFRSSLVWWMNSQLRGEMYISAKGNVEVPEDFFEEITRVPGVGGVDTFRNVQVVYEGLPVYITSIRADVLQQFARFGWVRGGDEAWDGVKAGKILISESFSRRFNVREGSQITLKGVNGPVSFTVAAVFYDYTTEHGLIMMDRTTYLKTFEDRTINSLGIFMAKDDPRTPAVLAEIRKRAVARGLPVATRAELHGNVLKVFDNTFAVTRSMRILAITVAFFGIAGALMTLFVERQREFGVYRALGFSTNQIAAMTLMEGIGMGLVSFLMSIATGTGLAVILIKVINLRSFNWTIFYHFALDPYLLALVTAIAASIGASLYPIWRVYRTYPQMQIRED